MASSEALTKALAATDREPAAKTFAEAVAAAASLKAAGYHDALKAALDGADAGVRESACVCFGALANLAMASLEPSLVALLPSVLERCADKVVAVRTAADAAVKILSEKINPDALKKVRKEPQPTGAVARCQGTPPCWGLARSISAAARQPRGACARACAGPSAAGEAEPCVAAA